MHVCNSVAKIDFLEEASKVNRGRSNGCGYKGG
jgi:hypothetical protein